MFHLNASQLYLFNLIERMVLVARPPYSRRYSYLFHFLKRELLPALLRSIVDNVRQGFAEDSRGTVRSPISTRIVTLHAARGSVLLAPLTPDSHRSYWECDSALNPSRDCLRLPIPPLTLQ